MPIRPFSKIAHPAVIKLIDRVEAIYFSPYGNMRLERRRLRILDAIFVAAERLGAAVQVADERGRNVQFVVGGVDLPLQVDAPSTFGRRREAVSPTMLELRLGEAHGRRGELGIWEERERKLDVQLREIVVGIFVAAETLKRERDVARAKAVRELQEWLEAEEGRKRLAAEKARVDALLAEADAHRRAADLRAFVTRARVMRVSPPTAEATTLDDWASWALSVANDIDPLGPPPLTDEPIAARFSLVG